MGRKKQPGHRRPNGRLSEAEGARGAHDEIAINQPHRRPFIELLGDSAARSYAASFALGRARLLGEAEETHGAARVQAVLFQQTGRTTTAAMSRFGISERLFFAGMRYATCVGRERWVRASPKDKPSAMAFMQARGISLSAHEITDEEANYYVTEFEEASAALMASLWPRDARSVLRTVRQMARNHGHGDMVTLLRGLGGLINPAGTSAVKRAVDQLVLDDRDLDHAALDLARAGLIVLADHFYGPERETHRPIRGVVHERPLWLETDFTAIEMEYRHYDGTPRKAGETPKPEPRSQSRGGWKGRHRSLAG